MTFNEKGLQKLAREWQAILRLSDWDVVVKIARKNDMVIPGTLGTCDSDLGQKNAVIQILDPRDYESKNWHQDHEWDLIHELLHLHFAPFMKHEGVEHKYQEQAIDLIANGLVKLKRSRS